MRVNLPNAITLSRIPVMFVIAALLNCAHAGAASVGFLLFIAAAIGDGLDGYLARRNRQVTNFGKLMDALTDKIMVLGIVIALVDRHKGRLFLFLALVTLCRELLVTGMRMVAATKGVVVAADKGGKSKTVTQLIALGLFLAAPMVRQDWSRLTSWDLSEFSDWVDRAGMAIFVVGTGLAVWSGWRYVARYGKVIFSEGDGA